MDRYNFFHIPQISAIQLKFQWILNVKATFPIISVSTWQVLGGCLRFGWACSWKISSVFMAKLRIFEQTSNTHILKRKHRLFRNEICESMPQDCLARSDFEPQPGKTTCRKRPAVRCNTVQHAVPEILDSLWNSCQFSAVLCPSQPTCGEKYGCSGWKVCGCLAKQFFFTWKNMFVPGTPRYEMGRWNAMWEVHLCFTRVRCSNSWVGMAPFGRSRVPHTSLVALGLWLLCSVPIVCRQTNMLLWTAGFRGFECNIRTHVGCKMGTATWSV